MDEIPAKRGKGRPRGSLNKGPTIARAVLVRDGALARAAQAEHLLADTQAQLVRQAARADSLERELADLRDAFNAAELATASRELTPIDIMLGSARQLYVDKNYRDANLAAARIAPFVHQRFGPSDQRPQPHPAQGMLPLFPTDQPAPRETPLGKKEQAQRDALKAGEGSDWGDDLRVAVRH